MESRSVLCGVRFDATVKDGEGRSETVDSMVTKQPVTLCGTIITALLGSFSCTLGACESHLSDDVILAQLDYGRM